MRVAPVHAGIVVDMASIVLVSGVRSNPKEMVTVLTSVFEVRFGDKKGTVPDMLGSD